MCFNIFVYLLGLYIYNHDSEIKLNLGVEAVYFYATCRYCHKQIAYYQIITKPFSSAS